MRIISHFSDYYDSVMKMGMDKSIIYVRDQETVEINSNKYELYSSRHIRTDYCTALHLLGYCGKIFHVFELYDAYTKDRFFSYNLEEFEVMAIAKDAALKSEFKSFRWWPNKYKKFIDQDISSALEIFHEYQVPLFLISTSESYKKQKILLNPSLRSLDFQKVKDTYTAYQDIFQYVAGTLNQKENSMVEISDKMKAEKHGFDKWSFRKLPTKKK